MRDISNFLLRRFTSIKGDASLSFLIDKMHQFLSCRKTLIHFPGFLISALEISGNDSFVFFKYTTVPSLNKVFSIQNCYFLLTAKLILV